MASIFKKSNFLKSKIVVLPFFLSFFLWIFLFRGFISHRLLLEGDANSYYTHFQFYIENIIRGVYPLWEPIRQHGVPSDFFMQRIGSYNPIFFLIVLIHRLGINYLSSYLIFLSVYYFIGMIGFYKLSIAVLIPYQNSIPLRVQAGLPVDEWGRRPTGSVPKGKERDPGLARGAPENSAISFIAFLLLTYSSLSTKVFESYIILELVPLIWFFFFCVRFFQEQDRGNLVGMVFCAMVLLSTYIPFYFILIAFLSLLFFIILYFKDALAVSKKFILFVKNNKLLVILSIFALSLSCLKGVALYKEFGKGEIIMPQRHSQSEDKNELAIDRQRVDEGGIQQDVIMTNMFSNLRYFRLGNFYVPIFLFIPLILGAITLINKRQMFFILLGGTIYLIGIANITPLAPFLYEHVFIFKLFRNYEHFLWLAILPIIVFLSVDLLKTFLSLNPRTKKEKALLFAFIFFAHAGFAYYIFCKEGTLITAYLTVLFSFIFYILYFLKIFEKRNAIFLLFLSFIVILHPIEVYSYLNKNSIIRTGKNWKYYLFSRKKPFLRLKLEDSYEQEMPVDNFSEDVELKPTHVDMTMATKWYYFLSNNIDPESLKKYLRHKLLIYDDVELISYNNLDLKKISYNLEYNLNPAGISLGANDDNSISDRKTSSIWGLVNIIPSGNDLNGISKFAKVVTEKTKEVKVLAFDVNYLKLRTNFDSPKFLVYNDSYHSQWKAFIDGREKVIWRANIAFKGLYVPGGLHDICFRFGDKWKEIFNYIAIVVFLGVFSLLVFLKIK